MSKTEVLESVQNSLRETMFLVLSRNICEEEKIQILTDEYKRNLLVEGIFSTEMRMFVDRETITFIGKVCGVLVEISVC